MDNITLRYVYDRKKKASSSNPQPLYIEVRINGTNTTTLVNTNIKLYPNQFDKKNGFTCKNHDRSALITRKAQNVFNEVYDFAVSEKCTSLDQVKNYREGGRIYTSSVVDFIEESLRRNNATLSVIQHHKSLISKIVEFGKINTFQDMTYPNIVDFDIFLRKTIKSSALNKRHKVLSKYISEAIKLGLCKSNPYENFDFKKIHDKERIFLTEAEVKKIQDYEAVGKLFHVKDLFIVQCFTGLSYIDLMNLSRDAIEEMDGYKIIRSNRVKTDGSFITLLLPEAEEILKRYLYNLPKISNQKYNEYLKLLALGAGIKKEISSHVARHTFATYLLNRNVPIETVSRALGHTSVKTTSIYAKMLGRKVIDDMKTLLK
jgi:site-specific recombinase XerD